MTAALLDRATTRPPASRQTRRPAGPKLRVLDQVAGRRRARRRSALLILFVAVLAGFFVVAFVHAELVAGQHELDAVRAEISQAEARHAELARAVEEASAPAVIVTQATELGMVRSGQPVYLAAAAPVRSIEVGPSLMTPAVAGGDLDGGEILQVAAPTGPASDATGDRSTVEGTLGVAGGISAAVRIPSTPTIALGTGTSPAGASTATGESASTATGESASTATGESASTATGESASTATGENVVQTAPAPTVPAAAGPAGVEASVSSGPTSSIAGTRAVSSPVANTDSNPVVANTDSSPVVAIATGTDTAGGLASAAATTSG